VAVPAFEVVGLLGVLGVSTGGVSTPAGWADAGVCINTTPTAKHKNRPIPFASIGSERAARMPSEGQFDGLTAQAVERARKFFVETG
jgi:hypothetical protein